MPPQRKFRNRSLQKLLEPHKELKVLRLGSIFCDACTQTLAIRPNSTKSTIEAHLSTIKHKTNLRLWTQQSLRQPPAASLMGSTENEFFADVTRLFARLNIPWARVNAAAFKGFSTKWCKQKAPDESTIRKNYVPPLYREVVSEIRRSIGEDSIYIQVDETADFKQRPLVSIIVGALNGKKPQSYLFDLIRLEESPNSNVIAQVITDTLYYFWEGPYDHKKLKVLISDQAAYMLKVGRDLKASLFPDLLHVTCLCHALHNVCQHAKVQYPNVEQLMRYFRKVFVKCPRRKSALATFIEAPLPKFPVDTRWGTWINFCSFLAANYDDIKTFAATMKDEKNSSIMLLLSALDREDTVTELIKVNELQFLVSSITRLETKGLTIYEQKQVIDDALIRLEDPFKAKLVSLLANNPAYEDIFTRPSMEERLKLRFTPLVSVDVERSFSAVKLIDTCRRQSFTAESLRHCAIVYANQVENGAANIEPEILAIDDTNE